MGVISLAEMRIGVLLRQSQSYLTRATYIHEALPTTTNRKKKRTPEQEMIVELSIKCMEINVNVRHTLEEMGRSLRESIQAHARASEIIRVVIANIAHILEQSTPIEATYQDDKRCFCAPSNSTLEALEERLVEIFSIDLFVYKMSTKYYDEDGDICAIGTSDKLHTLLSVHKGVSSSPLRIVVRTRPCPIEVDSVAKRPCEDEPPVPRKRNRKE
jgi:hypothetical protein